VPRDGTGMPVSVFMIARGVPKERTVIREVDVKLSPSVVGIPASPVIKSPACGVAKELGVLREVGGELLTGLLEPIHSAFWALVKLELRKLVDGVLRTKPEPEGNETVDGRS
jgi:hypothetical protein